MACGAGCIEPVPPSRDKLPMPMMLINDDQLWINIGSKWMNDDKLDLPMVLTVYSISEVQNEEGCIRIKLLMVF